MTDTVECVACSLGGTIGHVEDVRDRQESRREECSRDHVLEYELRDRRVRRKSEFREALD